MKKERVQLASRIIAKNGLGIDVSSVGTILVLEEFSGRNLNPVLLEEYLTVVDKMLNDPERFRENEAPILMRRISDSLGIQLRDGRVDGLEDVATVLEKLGPDFGLAIQMRNGYEVVGVRKREVGYGLYGYQVNGRRSFTGGEIFNLIDDSEGIYNITEISRRRK